MRNKYLILICFLTVFILCSLSFQPAVAKTFTPAIENECNCPISNDDRPVVLCILLFVLVFVPIPLLQFAYIILSIGYTLFPDLVDWEEIYNYIFFNLYTGRWMVPIADLIVELGCMPMPYEAPEIS